MTVFIVDDDKDDMSLIKEALAKNSYIGAYEYCANGQEAICRLAKLEQMPSLIILDLNMPVKDGYQTLKEIKSDKRLRNLVVVVLSTSSTESDKLKCEGYGCAKFYTKPWTLCGYVDMVRDMLFLIGYNPEK